MKKAVGEDKYLKINLHTKSEARDGVIAIEIVTWILDFGLSFVYI